MVAASIFEGHTLFARIDRVEPPDMNDLSQDPQIQELIAELGRLKTEHGDLNDAIDALLALPAVDQLQIQRLKRRKLTLKDRISAIEDQLTPDIIA